MYELRGLTVALGGRTLLDRVKLDLAPGAVTVVIGPNGAGKSTLIRVMAGGRRPTAGRVSLHGRDLQAFRPDELARTRAVLSQSVTVAFAFRVEEVVRIGLPPATPARRAAGLVESALAEVGLADYAGRDCTTLSGGEQQRVHLARTLVQLRAAPEDGRPRWLLLDEPTAGLDLAWQLLVVDIARRHAESGGGVLAVLHDLNLAAVAADRIVAFDRGRIVADGTPADAITDRLLAEVYGVGLAVNRTPGTVFVLPARRPVSGSV